ncbi:Holliday junction resolvase RuvX [Candidatus Peribacteria bacterium]|nr:Holliday junction resolvase RuvX [Candidatus Peribacteria bacterium]
MNILALDIGLRRTGISYGETKSGIVIALDTMQHTTPEELSEQVKIIVKSKKIDHVIIGLPLLPSGLEGEQVSLVKAAAKMIENESGLTPEFLDERYTTKIHFSARGSDPDATAACALLTVWLDRKNAIDI